MKTFSFKKTEHHSLMKFYDASLDEDEVLEILRENFEDEDTVQRYLTALSLPNHEDHEDAVSIITGHETVWDRWEWLDEDDLWTDRKGGYDVDYAFLSVDESMPDSVADNEAAPWPFPNVSPPDHSSESSLSVPKIEVCGESGEYKIEIYSRGLDAGIGVISLEQYEYWQDRDEDELRDALTENIDWEESECPENARFSGYYNEYYDVGAHGPDADYSHIVITSPSGVKIYEGEISELYDKINNAISDDCRAYTKFVSIEDMSPGHYVMWQDGGKGCYFEGQHTCEYFDFSKLTFEITEFEGLDIIEAVYYDGVEVENWGGSWDGKYNSVAVYEVLGDDQ